MDKDIEIRKLQVEDNGRKMQVFIAGDDKGQLDAIEEAQEEKVKEDWKRHPAKEKSKKSKEEIAGALKEYKEYKDRKREGRKKWY